RAWGHASGHRDRCNPTITHSRCLRRRDQPTSAFVEKRRYCGKPLSDGFNIDHHHNIWCGNSVVNPYLTLSKVDSIISGRALSGTAVRVPLPPAKSHRRTVSAAVGFYGN